MGAGAQAHGSTEAAANAPANDSSPGMSRPSGVSHGAPPAWAVVVPVGTLTAASLGLLVWLLLTVRTVDWGVPP